MKHIFTSVLGLLLLTPTLSFAQPAPPPPRPNAAPAAPVKAEVQHNFSLTFSPIHLLSPIVELTGEYRVMDKLGLALVVGGGKITTETTTFFPEETYTVFEAGAQARYYVLGDFDHGMQLGAEALYLYVDRDEEDVYTASGDGLAIGPFIGYKIATNIGFTFDTQLGVQYVTAKADATDGSSTATEEDTDIIPLLNLNVGWSF